MLKIFLSSNRFYHFKLVFFVCVLVLMLAFVCKYSLAEEMADRSIVRKEYGADIHLGIHVDMDKRLSELPDNRIVDDILIHINPDLIKENMIIFFVDTLRRDVISQYAPSINNFLEDNVSAVHIAGASATYHSTFSLFHSQPSFLAYVDYLQPPKNKRMHGSVFFKLLKKGGMDLYALGLDAWELDKSRKPGSDTAIIESYFGIDKILLQPLAKENSLSDVPYTDDQVTEAFKRVFLQRKSDKKENPALYWLIYFNAHNPYAWDKGHQIPYPEVNHFNGVGYGMLQEATQHEIQRAYANAVASVDHQFGLLLDFLKAKGEYEKTTIVLISDHGECLGEKTDSTNSKKSFHLEIDKKMYFHGLSLYKEVIEVPFAVKFPERINERLKEKNISSTLYGIDFFPTIFDGLGFDLNPLQSLIKGKSLFSLTNINRSSVIALPNALDPTYKLALINQEYKVQIQIDLDSFYHANAFTVINITDLDDRPIFDKPPFDIFGLNKSYGVCDKKSELIEKIKNDFSEALDMLFGRPL